ncbi:hypothetical protein [Nitrospira sp. M1]
MPYHFPYEEVFVWGISTLIFALLCLRVVVVRRQRQAEQNRNATTEK